MKGNMKGKKIVALLICLLMIFVLTACGDGNKDKSTTRDTLNVAVSLDSGTLDPIGITGVGGYLNIPYTYMEALMDYHEGAVIEYVLATDIKEVSSTQYTLHLREGVKFNNGSPFTADDVLFSMERVKTDPARMLDVQYVDFDKTNIVDDYTIDLWFTQYNAINFIKLSQLLICDAETFDAKTMATEPVGTGPYKVTDYVVNSHVTVEARDDYWGDKPAIKTINFKCLNEPSQVTNALETGDVDYAKIPMNDVEYVEGLGKYSIETGWPGADITSYYNMSPGGLLASKDARDAISYATDRQSMIDVAYNKLAGPVYSPVSPHLTDYQDRFNDMDDTYKTGFDLDKAKASAEKAGLTGKTLRIITNGEEQYITIAQILQADLGKIGITAEIKNYDQATYYATIIDPSNYEIALYSVAGVSMTASDVLAAYPTFFTLGWDDKERLPFVEQANEVLSTPDDTQRSEKLYELMKKFLEYAPWYGICDLPTKSAVSKDIKGFEYMLCGDLRWQDWSFN